MNTAKQGQLYETTLVLDTAELTTVTMAALRDGVPILGRTAVSRSFILTPSDYNQTRTERIDAYAEYKMELHDDGFSFNSRRLKLPHTPRGAQYLMANLLIAQPDSAVGLASADKTADLDGAITSLLRKRPSGEPILQQHEIEGRKFYSIRTDTVVVDNRDSSDKEDSDQDSVPLSRSGAALFKGELSGDAFIQILNIPFLNLRTQKVEPTLPPSIKVNSITILSDTRILFNGESMEPGKHIINCMNRLLAAYHGPPLTLAELLQTENTRTLENAEVLARRLQAQGVIVRGVVEGKHVLALNPAWIEDKRPAS